MHFQLWTQQYRKIPPKPPDIERGLPIPSINSTPINTNTYSFKEKLFFHENVTYSLINANTHVFDYSESMMVDYTLNSISSKIKSIALTEEDRGRMYTPLKFSLIIKLLGKRVLHQYLKTNVQDLWKPNEPFTLIDIGPDF